MGHDHRFLLTCRHAPRTDLQTDRDSLEGTNVILGQPRGSGVSQMNSICLKKKNRAKQARGLLFDDATQCLQHGGQGVALSDRSESTRLNSSHGYISYAVFCLKKKK